MLFKNQSNNYEYGPWIFKEEVKTVIRLENGGKAPELNLRLIMKHPKWFDLLHLLLQEGRTATEYMYTAHTKVLDCG